METEERAVEESGLIEEAQAVQEEPTKTVSVTLEEVQSNIVSLEYFKVGKKTTVGLATLKNGFEICMSAACVDEKNFDMEIGMKLVRQRIEDKVWELLGFNLQEMKFYAAQMLAVNQLAS